MVTQQSATSPADRRVPRWMAAPSMLVVAGAGCLSGSAVFVKLAGVGAGSTAFLRCAVALVALVPLTAYEYRRHGRLDPTLRRYAVAAGAFLGLDYALWTQSILDVGAGIATVLNNVQVIAFPMLALVFSRSPIKRRFLIACPVMVAGIALTSGVLSHSPHTVHQVRGSVLGVASGIAYAAYLYLNRLSGHRSPRHIVTPVCVATGAAAVVTGGIGMFTTGITTDLPAISWVWIVVLALVGQVAAWLLLAIGSPKLAPNASAALLLLHPVFAVALSLVVLHETPTTSQLVGCVIVIAAVGFATSTPRSAHRRSGGLSAPGDPSPGAA